MLGQSHIGKYLDQCGDSRLAIEEVLSAYIVWKYLKGATTVRVLAKIRLLCFFLRATRRSRILVIGADAIKALSIEVAMGGGRLGLLPAMTLPGKAVWNELRRAAHHGIATDNVYGGPGPVQAFLTESQRRRFEDDFERTAWAEQYFATRVQLISQAPEYVTASQRNTTLPQYASREFRESVSDHLRTIARELDTAHDGMIEG